MGEIFRVKWVLVYIEFILEIILGNLGFISIFIGILNLFFIYYGVYLVIDFFWTVMECNDSLALGSIIIGNYALVSEPYSVIGLDLLPILWQFRHLMFR